MRPVQIQNLLHLPRAHPRSASAVGRRARGRGPRSAFVVGGAVGRAFGEEVGDAVVVGTLCCDVLLGDVRSLKQKRSVIRPLVAELSRRFAVSAAETGVPDLYRRAEISVAVVSGNHAHAREVLESCERLIAGRPEIELLSTRTRVLDDEDVS